MSKSIIVGAYYSITSGVLEGKVGKVLGYDFEKDRVKMALYENHNILDMTAILTLSSCHVELYTDDMYDYEF